MLDWIRSETTIKACWNRNLKTVCCWTHPQRAGWCNVREQTPLIPPTILSYSSFFSSSVTLSLCQLWKHPFLHTDILQVEQTELKLDSRVNKLGPNDQRRQVSGISLSSLWESVLEGHAVSALTTGCHAVFECSRYQLCHAAGMSQLSWRSGRKVAVLLLSQSATRVSVPGFLFALGGNSFNGASRCKSCWFILK